MRSFSATEAAFAGYRLIGKNPMLVVMWSLVSFVFLLAIVGMFAALAGGPIMSLVRLEQGATPSTEQVASLFLTMLPAILLALPLLLIFNGVMVAGVNRAILRPTEGGFFFLKLGGDELRLAVVLLVQGLAAFGVNFVASMFQGIVTVGSIAATGGDFENASSSPIGLLLQLVTWCVLIFLNIKFCLALPQSFDKRSIDIFGTWSLTNGRFWPILGAYLLCGLLAVILILVVVGILIGGAVAFGVSLGLGAAAQTPPDMTAIIPFALVGGVIYGVAITVANTTVYAVAPSIYGQITGTEDTAATFA